MSPVCAGLSSQIGDEEVRRVLALRIENGWVTGD